MITYSEVKIKEIAIHYVGNKTEGQDLNLSPTCIDIKEEELLDHLKDYFFSNFKDPEYFTFNKDMDEMSPIEMMSNNIFSGTSFIETSQKLATHLYHSSDHPNIKSGDLMVVLFEDVLVGDEMISAIGLFKSETKLPFLEINKDVDNYQISSHFGISLNKIDKASLILNTEIEEEYKVCIIDKSNKTEAKYWKEHFLNLVPRNDQYHATANYIKATKDFVKDQLAPLEDLDKSEVAAIMNRSSEFFTKVETFNEEEYAEQVFKDPTSIEAFKNYKEEYNQSSEHQLEGSFDIDQDAVKKNKRLFKSILKLDKNFHVYIHGSKDKIERGESANGQKFYKLYYDVEN